MKEEDDGILFSSRKKKKKKTYRKKNATNGRGLPFFSCFCIWDEMFFLPSPFHVLSTLSSPPSSSLASHVSLKLCATQAQELF
jgi:hypothetical protein